MLQGKEAFELVEAALGKKDDWQSLEEIAEENPNYLYQWMVYAGLQKGQLNLKTEIVTLVMARLLSKAHE